MNVKNIYQIIIILLIILISFYIYNKYLKKSKVENKVLNTTDEVIKKTEQIDGAEKTSIIENIKYFNEDAKGNKFILEARTAENVDQNPNYFLLSDVSGIINFKNKSEIYIFSKFAYYDSINFDTKFFSEVSVKYEGIPFNIAIKPAVDCKLTKAHAFFNKIFKGSLENLLCKIIFLSVYFFISFVVSSVQLGTL